MKLTKIAAGGLALAILFGAADHPAEAGCFELVGCTNRDPFTEFDLSLKSCERLNFIRNSIFAEKGYCFRQSKYREMFGTYECRYRLAAEVPLNEIERDNILKIRRMESEKACLR